MVATKAANHALQRTAAGRHGCNRRVSWPPSLSLGRWAYEPLLLCLDSMN
jgi:hypothetical protein